MEPDPSVKVYVDTVARTRGDEYIYLVQTGPNRWHWSVNPEVPDKAAGGDWEYLASGFFERLEPYLVEDKEGEIRASQGLKNEYESSIGDEVLAEWERDLLYPKDEEEDVVNHPDHYTQHPSGVECIQITEHMSFTLGNVIKYVWRADLKGKDLEDLKKARFYLDREIAKREAESG